MILEWDNKIILKRCCFIKMVVGFILVFIVIGLWGCGSFDFNFIIFDINGFIGFDDSIDNGSDMSIDGWVSGGIVLMVFDFLDDFLFESSLVCSVVLIGV